jgi:hypothetical protein
MLRLIAMDKAHILVQLGMSFHKEICVLRVDFFQPVYGNQPRNLCLWLIALTAGIPSSYVWLLSTLLIVD